MFNIIYSKLKINFVLIVTNAVSCSKEICNSYWKQMRSILKLNYNQLEFLSERRIYLAFV